MDKVVNCNLALYRAKSESESDDDVSLFDFSVNSYIPTNAAKPALIYPSPPRQAWIATAADEALSANGG